MMTEAEGRDIELMKHRVIAATTSPLNWGNVLKTSRS